MKIDNKDSYRQYWIDKTREVQCTSEFMYVSRLILTMIYLFDADEELGNITNIQMTKYMIRNKFIK